MEPFYLLRREGSNLRPSGYEPDELPLLYFAMWTANLRSEELPSKLILHFLSLADERKISPDYIFSRHFLQTC